MLNFMLCFIKRFPKDGPSFLQRYRRAHDEHVFHPHSGAPKSAASHGAVPLLVLLRGLGCRVV